MFILLIVNNAITYLRVKNKILVIAVPIVVVSFLIISVSLSTKENVMFVMSYSKRNLKHKINVLMIVLRYLKSKRTKK